MTQVDQIQKIADQPDLFRGGLMSRFMLCVPDPLAGRRRPDGKLIRQFDDKREICPKIREAYHRKINELLDESDAMSKFRDIEMEPAAKAVFAEYYNRVEEELGPHGELEECADAAVRFSFHALRMALISSLCRGGNLVINSEDMANGVKLMEYFEEHTERALQMMYHRSIPENPRKIIRYLKKTHSDIFSARDAQRGTGIKTSDDVQNAIKWLATNHYCRLVDPKSNERVGSGRKRSPEYEVNPKLFQVQ